MYKKPAIVRVLAAAASCVLALGLVIGLNGCGKPNDEELIRTSITEVMEVFKNPTKENLAQYVEAAGDDLSEFEEYGIDIYEFMEHSFAKFDYTIGDVTVDGDTATADLTLTNVDLKTTLETVQEDIYANVLDYSEMFDAEDEEEGQRQFMQLFFQKIYDALDASEEVVSTDAQLKLNKVDGEWQVDETSLNAVVGGMYGGIEL